MAAMLADPAIDVVEISTPHSTHYALTKAALEAGKHVVCDKAFVGTVAEAEELFALAAEKGVTVQCYQNRRFDSDLLTAKKVVESGKLGEVFVAASTSFTCIVMVGIAGLHSIKAEYAVLYHQYRTSATHSRGCGRNPGHELHQLWPAQIAGILTQGNSATTPAL